MAIEDYVVVGEARIYIWVSPANVAEAWYEAFHGYYWIFYGLEEVVSPISPQFRL